MGIRCGLLLWMLPGHARRADIEYCDRDLRSTCVLLLNVAHPNLFCCTLELSSSIFEFVRLRWLEGFSSVPDGGAMSKILFTIALPHDRPDGSRASQFFISYNNNTCLSMKGFDFKSAKFGNSNIDPGWKNRFEYSVTASRSVTRFSL
jgi:hypothetical protein